MDKKTKKSFISIVLPSLLGISLVISNLGLESAESRILLAAGIMIIVGVILVVLGK